jgi:hypothetical protein
MAEEPQRLLGDKLGETTGEGILDGNSDASGVDSEEIGTPRRS